MLNDEAAAPKRPNFLIIVADDLVSYFVSITIVENADRLLGFHRL